jgi:glucose/arabinose dehydrogenase
MRRLLVLLAACQGSSQAATGSECELVQDGYGPVQTADVRVDVVASGLEVPWGLAFLPDKSLLVTERPGRIQRIVDGKASLVANVPIAGRGEGGLLGLALAPDFAHSHAFYIYYTTDTMTGPRNRVERWRLADNLASARPDRVIVDDIPSAPYHDGGRIAFGPDHALYIGTGDATQPQHAQNPTSPSGKILRVDPSGKSAVYISGVRNAEAFDWRSDGALAIADHGPSGEMGRTGHDRVFLLSHPAGANLGWPTVYGCETRAGFAAPALSWTEAVPPGGAAFYGDGSIAAWRGDFLIGTLKSQHLHRVRFDHDGRVIGHSIVLEGRGRLRTVAIGPDHELYVMTSNCDGRGTCPREGDLILRVTSR